MSSGTKITKQYFSSTPLIERGPQGNLGRVHIGPKGEALSSSNETVKRMLIDLYDTTEGEVAYWQDKAKLSRPETLTVETVKELQGRMAEKPVELRPVIPLNSGSYRILSSHGDRYFFVNSKFCSCQTFRDSHTCQHVKAALEGKYAIQ